MRPYRLTSALFTGGRNLSAIMPSAFRSVRTYLLFEMPDFSGWLAYPIRPLRFRILSTVSTANLTDTSLPHFYLLSTLSKTLPVFTPAVGLYSPGYSILVVCFRTHSFYKSIPGREGPLSGSRVRLGGHLFPCWSHSTRAGPDVD